MCPPEGCLEKTECAPTVGPYLILLQALWDFALKRDSWTSQLPASALCKTAQCTRLAFQSIHFKVHDTRHPPAAPWLLKTYFGAGSSLKFAN